MFATAMAQERPRVIEALTWDPRIDREAEQKRQELERLLDELDDLED